MSVWSLVEAVPAYLSGRLVAAAVDHGFLRHRPATGFAYLGVLGVAVLIGGWATRQLYPNLAALVEPLRDRLVTITVRSSIERSTRPGSPADTAAVARLTRQVEIVREAYASVLVICQGFIVSTVSALVGLASLAPAALVLVVPPLLVALAVFAGSLGSLSARQRESILAEERISETMTDIVDARRDITACGGEAIVQSAADVRIDAHALATRRLASLAAVRNLAVSVGGLVPVILVLLGSPWLRRHGASTGTILGVLTYVLSGVHPALQSLVRGLGTNGVWLVTTLRRLLDGKETVEPRSDPALQRQGAPSSFTPDRPVDVELRNATFAWSPAAEPVVRDLNLYIPDGDHLAVIGPSGIGKSTLADLLSGILVPDSGDVLLGGTPVSQMGPTAIVNARVLVPEEAYVFEGSIEDNLTYLNPRAARPSIDQAADLLGARSLLDRFDGSGAEIAPGSLSAGERQLIALVRAYLCTARLVILDEATCHLDPSTEARVERAFANRPGTLVVIAHRISSALRAKRVLVMDGAGCLLGTPGELLATSEMYRDLLGHWTAPTPTNGSTKVTTGSVKAE